VRVHQNLLCVGLLLAAVAAAPGCGSGSKPADSPAVSIPATTPPTTAASRPKPARPPENLHPKVVLSTSLGDVVLQLNAEKAPQTVRNFLTYVHEGHFDQTLFHQVVKGSLIVGGTYDINRVERKVHPPIRNEADNGLKNRRGTIAMARRPDAVDSATSQFFLNLADNEYLDHKERTLKGFGYCVFGEIIQGMEILDQIGNVPVNTVGEFESTPIQPILVKTARPSP
jgi:cyclophilin family peptidyl-prolyl cis-trans isomerase